LADDEERHRLRQRLLREWSQRDRWPDLAELLGQESIAPSDRSAYAAATAVTEFLLTKGSRTEFVAFVAAGQRHGWTKALRQAYAINGLADLQRQWQSWAADRLTRATSPAANGKR